ncbi:MAG: hypothetical protein HOH04_13695 [Rhodospirillaceae bacterium]|jgi:hypothetical protein|nr:hypothetical protein [Rhodospirillaceae bacterium]
MLKTFVFVIAMGSALVSATAPARADQIDGHWCQGLKHLYIDGPKIVTPGGKEIAGEYDRHGFKYVAPAGDVDAGATVVMRQAHDELMHLQSSAKPGDTQEWIRCNRQIS